MAAAPAAVADVVASLPVSAALGGLEEPGAILVVPAAALLRDPKLDLFVYGLRDFKCLPVPDSIEFERNEVCARA